MKRVVLFGMGFALLTIISFGCGGGKTAMVDDIGLTNSPTTMESLLMTCQRWQPPPAEIKKAGAIRVIAESAKGQSQYDALTAARGLRRRGFGYYKRG